MKKRIFSIIILVFILSYIIFSISAFANVEIDYTDINNGYIIITADTSYVNKYLFAGNFASFTSTYENSSWLWKLQFTGSADQVNANYWALFPFATSVVDPFNLDNQGIYFDDLPDNVEVSVTYKLQGLGALFVDDFIPITIYDINPGIVNVNDIRNNISNSQTLNNTSKFTKRDTTYFYDTKTDTAYVSYTTNTNEFEYINDLVFVKHNASITYNHDLTFILIPEIKIKLNYSDAQKLLNQINISNENTKQIVEELKKVEYLFTDEGYDDQSSIDTSAEQKIEDFETELSKAVAPEIEMSIPDVDIPDFNDSDDFMDVLLSCPGYLTLLTLSTSLWVVKLLIFGKG